ncbi:MAG: hypothetical protein SV186_00330 [Candidatus Nanohaloarchaea archaeon]|nr:hypothetical protein [Candidatus Nanohaloarchaea archaeon]
MNQITLTRIINDLSDDLSGLHWAVSGNAAVQIYTGSDIEVIDIDGVMDLKNYPEAALRLDTDVDTHIDSSGVKVFELEQVYRDVPVSFRTTNFEHELDLFDRVTYRRYNDTDVPVVPPEYLLANLVQQDGRERDIKALREQLDIDADYLRTCIRVLGVEANLLGDMT